MIKKIICKQCLKLPKFEIFYKSKIYNIYQINPKSLDLKFGQGYNSKKIVYRFMLENAIEKFRINNKFTILKILEKEFSNHEILNIVKNINIKSMDKPRNLYLGYSPNFDERYPLESYKQIFEYIRMGSFKISKLSTVVKQIRLDFQ